MAVRQLRTADAARVAQASGFDAVYIDLEHSPMTEADASNICIAAAAVGVTPLVRVRSSSARDIALVLDGGAHGVIVPHVGSAQGAQAAVAHAKFPPAGSRSVSMLNPTMGFRAVPLAESIQQQNALTMVVAMIETPEGAVRVEEIAGGPDFGEVMAMAHALS